ncbi:Ankrd52 [Symbiodinium sp. CCMP2592]|nr:Ankrd52 [Symbiodinium sp. CCMP2592]
MVRTLALGAAAAAAFAAAPLFTSPLPVHSEALRRLDSRPAANLRRGRIQLIQRSAGGVRTAPAVKGKRFACKESLPTDLRLQ